MNYYRIFFSFTCIKNWKNDQCESLGTPNNYTKYILPNLSADLLQFSSSLLFSVLGGNSGYKSSPLDSLKSCKVAIFARKKLFFTSNSGKIPA